LKATIKSVADAAGVSRGTVDRVLNGRPHVKPVTKAKVLEALRSLDYVPNWAAKALAFQDSKKKIAVVMPRLESEAFISEIYKGIRQARNELQQFGIEVVDIQCKDRMKDTQASAEEYIQIFDSLVNQGICGLVTYSTDHPLIRDKVNEISARGIPVITVNSDISNCRRKCFVGDDEYKNGRIAADVLLKCIDPASDILAITASYKYYSSKARIEGFCAKLSEQNVCEGQYKVHECFNSYELTYEKVSEELRHNPRIRSVYMSTENVLGCIDAVKNAHLPYKIAIVCHGPASSYKEHVINEDITFLLAQNLFVQGYRSLMLMKDIIFFNKMPRNEYEQSIPVIICKELAKEYC